MIDYHSNLKALREQKINIYAFSAQFFFICLLFFWQINSEFHLCASEFSINPNPVALIRNPCLHYSLINSVDFHPTKNLFCVTYTQCNRIVVYKYNDSAMPEIFQTLWSPLTRLREPQHAIFSPDGKRIIVANWTNETLTIYQLKKNGLYGVKPVAIIPAPSRLALHKPHGITISPCGKFLAVAYGAASYFGRAIGLFSITKDGLCCELVSLLRGEELPGIPKGITFSPDGSCLLATFCDVNSLVIFNFDRETQKLLQTPRQTILGEETQIFRPEDVKISPDGSCCAITNSDKHTLTFYSYDKVSNSITQNTPRFLMQNPEAQLCFPHGVAFSPDGSFLVVTEFGPISTSEDGDIVWNKTILPWQSNVKIYRTVR